MSTSCVPPAVPVIGEGLTSSRSDYAAAVDYLFGLINYERVPPASSLSQDFRLDRMRALLEAVGSPHVRMPTIHIAGTKGKGSTAAMLTAVLEAGGVKTGLFTSPHMQVFEERMTVNGERPTEPEIVSLTEAVRAAAASLTATRQFAAPTFFEVTTAIAWLYFERRQVDVVVLETGLGGRLDATNVCRPMLTMITSISRDHVHLLGDSLAEIAAEKAGIIKPGVPVISGVAHTAARQVIVRVAAENSAPITELGESLRLHHPRRNESSDARGPGTWTGDIETSLTTHASVTAPLPGVHQLRNLALAVAALDQLRECGILIDDATLHTGLSRVQWPLRIEVIRRQPLVIVDSAHNDASIQALLDTILEVPARRRHIVFGTSRDKDADAMLRLLAGHFDNAVLTEYASNPRALPCEMLAGIARKAEWNDFVLQPDPGSAWEFVRRTAHPEDLICVTGSFFLAAEFRELLAESAGSHAGGQSRSTVKE